MKIFTFIDFGNTKTHCVVVNIGPNSFDVLSSISQKTVGFANGYVTNMKLLQESMYDLIHHSEQESKSIINDVVIILSGEYFSIEYVTTKISLRQTTVSQEDLDRIIQKAKQYNKNDTSIVHHNIMHYEMDDHIMIENPIGMIGNELSIKIQLIRAKNTPLMNIFTCLDQINISVKKVLFANYVIGYAYKMYSEDGNFCAIDIGSHLTKISVFEKNLLIDYAMFQVGGEAITNEITQLIRIPKSQAERIKVLYGSAINSPYSNMDDDEIVMASIDNDMIQVSRTKVNDIISAQIGGIISLIQSQKIIKGDCMILSGGVSLLPNISDMFLQFFDINVIIPTFKEINTLILTLDKQTKNDNKLQEKTKYFTSQDAVIVGAILYIQHTYTFHDSSIKDIKNNKSSIFKNILLWISRKH